jgi:hypothetical protein
MSHYSCPVCTGSTSVIETRVSKKGLRRRRRCANNHRFTTFELPHDTGKRAIDLVKWLSANLDAEIAEYALEEIRAIVAGTPPEPEEDLDDGNASPPSATTPVCGPTGTHGRDPRSDDIQVTAAEAGFEAGSEASIQPGREATPAPEALGSPTPWSQVGQGDCSP